MDEMPQDSRLDRLLDHATGLAQAGLDLAVLAVAAGLIWVHAPARPRAAHAPLPVAMAACQADCIETRPLTSGS